MRGRDAGQHQLDWQTGNVHPIAIVRTIGLPPLEPLEELLLIVQGAAAQGQRKRRTPRRWRTTRRYDRSGAAGVRAGRRLVGGSRRGGDQKISGSWSVHPRRPGPDRVEVRTRWSHRLASSQAQRRWPASPRPTAEDPARVPVHLQDAALQVINAKAGDQADESHGHCHNQRC